MSYNLLIIDSYSADHRYIKIQDIFTISTLGYLQYGFMSDQDNRQYLFYNEEYPTEQQDFNTESERFKIPYLVLDDNTKVYIDNISDMYAKY